MGIYDDTCLGLRTDSRCENDIEGFAGVRLGPGTLYGCIAKLEKAGLVEALPSEDRRHPYRITAAGLEAVKERLVESARIAEIGLSRVAGAMS